MTKARPDFKRMLLKLPHSRQDYAAVTLIAELAELFGVDLVGTYVDDVSPHGLAELPNAREFRGGTWRPLSPDQLVQDVAIAAREAARLFLENAGRGRSRLFFSSSAGAASREAGIEDIIAVIEPMSAIERATHQFAESLQAAFRSTSSVLLVPGHAKPRSGPIIAITSGPDDPGLAAALTLASSSRERLILIRSQPTLSWSAVLERAKLAGVTTSVAEAVFDGGNILLPAFAKGRLLIMTRELVGQRPASQTPILFVSSALSSRVDG